MVGNGQCLILSSFDHAFNHTIVPGPEISHISFLCTISAGRIIRIGLDRSLNDRPNVSGALERPSMLLQTGRIPQRVLGVLAELLIPAHHNVDKQTKV